MEIGKQLAIWDAGHQIRAMDEGVQALESAAEILLVDWPSVAVPRALLEAGRTVYGYSPTGYSIAKLVSTQPDASEGRKIFVPNEGEEGYLVFEKIPARPARLDMVVVYRLEQELPQILEQHVLTTGAKWIWLLSPVSADARKAISRNGSIGVIADCDIVAAARALRRE